MIHPQTALSFIDPIVGFGVIATKRIPRGTITWARDRMDSAMTEAEVTRLGPLFRAQLDRFSFIDGAGLRILCWDIARYVNHSCEAVCLAPGVDFEIAVRDIEPGEQLTDDYGTLNLTEPFECACSSKACRKIIQPDDPMRLADGWDAQVQAAFPEIDRVEQPLWPLINRPDDVNAVLQGRAPYPSCRAHFVKNAARAGA
jgi:uncharacterized protein